MQIIRLKNSEIDYVKWDHCIQSSHNRLVYAETWYLDIVSPGWQALVMDDYRYVMPLTLKRKWGIDYIVQPILTQQLGVFSSEEISLSILELFVKNIPVFSYYYQLNYANNHPKFKSLPNFVLSLSDTYSVISSNFSKNTTRNISKALKSQLEIRKTISVTDFLNFYFETERNFEVLNTQCLQQLITVGVANGKINLIGVFSPTDELIAALAYVVSGDRIIYLLPVSNAKGKESSAMFLLIDSLIQEFSDSPTLFDFEGSRIEGIARLYKGFGAENQPYNFLIKGRSQFLIRQFNKLR